MLFDQHKLLFIGYDQCQLLCLYCHYLYNPSLVMYLYYFFWKVYFDLIIEYVDGYYAPAPDFYLLFRCYLRLPSFIK